MFRPEVVNSLLHLHAKGKARYSDVVKKSCTYDSDRGDHRLTFRKKCHEKVPSANTDRVDSTFVQNNPVKTVAPVKKLGNKVRNVASPYNFMLPTRNRFSALQSRHDGTTPVVNNAGNVL